MDLLLSAVDVSLCLLLTSCAPAPQQPAGNSEAQVENLAKLWKCLGSHSKYTHPVFLLGERTGTKNCSSSSRLFPKLMTRRQDSHQWVIFAGGVAMEPSTASRSAAAKARRSAYRLTPAGSVRTIWRETDAAVIQLARFQTLTAARRRFNLIRKRARLFQSAVLVLGSDYNEESERLLELFVVEINEQDSPYRLMDESCSHLPEYISRTFTADRREGRYLTLLELMTYLGTGMSICGRMRQSFSRSLDSMFSPFS